MTKILIEEATVKQVLETLEENHHLIEEHERPEYLAQYDRVISAVSKALAEQPAQQEPTKEMLEAAERIDWSDSDVRGSIVNMWQAMCAVAPQPAQRTWVELTTEDKDAVVAKADVRVGADHNLSWREALISETAAKLAEKNT